MSEKPKRTCGECLWFDKHVRMVRGIKIQQCRWDGNISEPGPVPDWAYQKACDYVGSHGYVYDWYNAESCACFEAMPKEIKNVSGVRKRIKKLFVLWQASKTENYYTIGELWETANSKYAFGYRLDNLIAAKEAGFSLLFEFPEENSISNPRISDYLFATFLQRIPPTKRPDYGEMMTKWGVEEWERDNPLAILAKSRGILMNSHISLSSNEKEPKP